MNGRHFLYPHRVIPSLDGHRRRQRLGAASSDCNLVYAGENGTSRSANKKTQYLNFAPRLGLTYGLTSDARTVLRTGFGITHFPSPYAAGNLNHLNVPFVISQDQPTRLEPGAADRGPVSTDRPRQADDDRGADRGQSSRVWSRLRDETAYAEQWHLGIERQLLRAMLLELEYVGSGQEHLTLCYNPNEVQPGPGTQDSRRLLQPIASVNNMLQWDPRNRSTYHAGTLRLQQRFTNGAQFLVSYTYGRSLDYGGSAASGGGAVGNGQTITNMDAWHGPSGFDVRHRTSMSRAGCI